MERNRLFSFCISLILILASCSLAQTVDFETCRFEELPTTFNSLSYLGFNGEFHLQGEFRANFSEITHNIFFNLTQESVVRFYVAPHAVDVDIWLYNVTSGFFVGRSSLDIGTEEVLFKDLPAGNYRMQFTYFGFWVGKYQPTSCDSLVVEFAVSPASSIRDRVSQFSCPAQENIPNPDFSRLSSSGFFYDSVLNQTSTIFNLAGPNSTNIRAIRWANPYNFVVPDLSQDNAVWALEATIGADFLTSGSIGLLLVANDNETSPTPNFSCLRDGTCTIGQRVRSNRYVLMSSIVPGNYTLWLFEKLGEKLNGLTPCNPFSMTLRLSAQEQEENLLTCGDIRPIPKVLLPGFDAPDGTIHFADDVLLDGGKNVHSVAVTIATSSYFRVRTSHPKIDIDIRVVNTDTGRTVDGGYRLGNEEGVSLYLSPANYSVSIIYFGSYKFHSCDSFFLEVAATPDYLLQGYFTCPQTSSLPDLSGLAAAPTSNYSLPLNTSPYVFVYNGDYSKRAIQTTNFNVSAASNVRVYLGDFFLLGDLEVFLQNFDDGTTTQLLGDYHRNHEYLSATVEPGTYAVVISTGAMQRSALNNFPTCAFFTFSLHLHDIAHSSACTVYERIPTSLNSIEYLGSSGIVHLQQQFVAPLDPPSGNWNANENMYFTVANASVFRVWTEPNILDVDFYLYEGSSGSPVVTGVKLGVEEEITYQLKANTPYRLQFRYYYFGRVTPAPKCLPFTLELGIVPIWADPAPRTCLTSYPPTTLIPDFNGDSSEPFYVEKKFRYSQTSVAQQFNLPFVVSDGSIIFRAFVEHSFVWADLSLTLVTVTNTGVTSVYAEGGYNLANLESILLGPGNYTLIVYEPSTAAAGLRRCIDFSLVVTYQSADGPTESSPIGDPIGCETEFLPATFNALEHLSVITGNRVHFKSNVLADVQDRTDAITFTVAVPSAVSVFVPQHPVIDIDIYLKNSTSTMIARTGFAEEAIFSVVQPGDYSISFRYYGYRGARLPPASDCTSFPLELSVMPVSYLESINTLTSRCDSVPIFPTLLETNYTSTVVTRAVPPTSSYTQKTQFEIEQGGLLKFDLRYFFPAGGLYFDMLGTLNQQAVTNKTYKAELGFNHAYLYRTLSAGVYNLTIRDIFSTFNNNLYDSNILCAPFEIDYTLIGSADVDPCADNDDLPTDLFSDEGESEPFGGPQDATDGSVRISGDTFNLDDSNGKNNPILFNVPVDSFLRIFSSAPAGNDIDFYVYKNTSRASNSLVYVSLGIDTVETALVRVSNQTDPYLLNVYFFKIDRKALCPSFAFEFAMKPVTVIQQELACPNTLPVPEVPPPTLTFNSDLYSYNEYIFTRDRIQANTVNYVFTYRITLNILYNTSIYTALGYDFLANDFRLALKDVNNNVVENGVFYSLAGLDTYYNFGSEIEADLTPGTYYLDVMEDIRRKNLGFEEFCHRFYFMMSSFVFKPAAIERVVPPFGRQLDPAKDLRISVTFSEAAHIPVTNNVTVLSYLTSTQAIYLTPVGSPGVHYRPSYAQFDQASRILSLVFPHTILAVRKTYQLMIDGSKFLTADNTPFASPTAQNYTYAMFDCVCSGHGDCPSPSVARCQCDRGYAGIDCGDCAPGYHGVGTDCVANVLCSANSCNGHGTCDDSQGYPSCVCDVGFATSGDNYCSICAAGFSNFPNCTQDDPSRVPLCTAPLLPSSLDSPGLLGFDGRVHLQNNYFIDAVNFRHDMTFSLAADSLMRVYAEPHWVDIDLWLYSLNDDGTINKLIETQLSINKEETIFRVLPGGTATHPLKYLLRFRYFVWNRQRVASCESFDMELAINPVAEVQREAALINSKCPSSAVLPNIPGNVANSWMTIPPSGFTFTASTPNGMVAPFALVSPATGKGPNFNYTFNFHLDVPPGKVAMLNAVVLSRFLPGSVALMLEVGTNQTHCASVPFGNDPETLGCYTGSSLHNQYQLGSRLLTGNYTLWIYEPRSQTNMTVCAPFDFTVDIEFVDEEEGAGCDAVPLPPNLNAPGYLNTLGHLHVLDSFLIDTTVMSLVVPQESFIRISGHSKSTVAFVLNNTVSLQHSAYSQNPTLFARLPAGQYYITLDPFIVSGGDCPAMLIEIQVAPNQGFSNSCPGTEQLPVLPNLRVPYEFGHTDSNNPVPVSYYAYTNNRVIKEYSFTVDETSAIDAMVSSDFLTGNLQLNLVFPVGSPIYSIQGENIYNRNELSEILDPGTYKLQITKDSSYSRPSNFPPCSEFNFELSLRTFDNITASPCLLSGEALPNTFNSIRFLGTDNHFVYQSSQFRVPSFASFYSHFIYINVTEPSVLRIYTEPHVVDIDLALYVVGVNRPVANGGYNFNNEESIVFELDPTKNYKLQLMFWKWSNNDIPDCPVFNMEVGISPIVPLPSTCPQSGGDHWPPAIPAGTTQIFHYSSEEIGENLYFQQRVNEVRAMNDWNVTLGPLPTTWRSILGYDFISGDLVQTLTNQKTGEVFSGDNTANGNVLEVMNLPPGTYSFEIHEVVVNLPDYEGCSNFTFRVDISASEDELMPWEYLTLPSTLNSIAYLNTNNRVHLQGYYALFGTKNNEKITFTLTTKSLLRVSTQHYVEDLDEIQVVVNQGSSPFAVSMETMLEVLPAATYTLTLRRPRGGSTTGTVFVDVQLSIVPVDKLNADIGAPYYGQQWTATCQDTLVDPIQLPATGAYQYHRDDLTVSMGTMSTKPVVQTVPFTLSKTSKFYARISAPFALADFELMLTGQAQFSNQTIAVYGDIGRNTNDLNTVLGPGTYSLILSQNSLFDIVGDVVAHCTPFSMYISIVDTAGNHIDCSYLDVLPWDLSSSTGGSQDFGGPMDNSGNLIFSGDSFIMPTSASQKDVIAMTINTRTLIAVTTRSGFLNSVSFKVQTPTNSNLSPITTLDETFQGQHGEIHLLEHPGTVQTPLNYSLVFSYRPPYRVPCPYFGLQVVARPISQLERELVCPENVNPILPTKAIPVSDNGAFSESIHSYFPKSTKDNSTVMGQFIYEIKFSVTQRSHVAATMGYNSLADMYKLRLMTSTPNGGKSEIGRSSWHFQTGHSDTNINQVLTGTLIAGTYYIQIREQRFSLPINTRLGDDLCFPFSWNIQIFPDSGLPYIASVEPSGAEAIDPTNGITLELAFSSPIFDASHNPITADSPVKLLRSVYLLSDKNVTVWPSLVRNSGGSFWFVTFPGPFQASTTYTLQILPSSLFDASGNAVQNLLTSSYTTLDTSCTGNGEFDLGMCFCNTGYAGVACELCDIGFKNVNPTGPVHCVQRTGKLCLIDSCGCDPKSTSTCIPIGVCNDTSGAITCKCPSNYAGAYCTQCANGYGPLNAGCPKSTSCNCVRGTCNTETNTCICPEHFTGPTCEVCASGWGGADCSSEIGPGVDPQTERTINVFKVIGIVLSVLTLVVVIAWMLYRRFGYKPVYVQLDQLDDPFDQTELDDN